MAKIAIFSDSHDNWPNLKKAVDWIKSQGISLIIHCGDLCAYSVLKKLVKRFSGQIHLVYGNVCERDLIEFEKESEKFKNVKLYGDQGEITIDGIKIVFIHKPTGAKLLAESGKYDLVFYGHTHRPWLEKVGNCFLVNPGTLSGMFYRATFAIFDTKNNKLELKILDAL